MWYFAREGRQQGPVSDEQIRRMAQDGSLRREDLVWKEGMAEWRPASQVPELNFPPAPVPSYQSPPPPPPQYSPAVYSPPPPPSYGAPQAQYNPMGTLQGASIPNYLPWAIAATLLCCWPAGIPAIIFANKANNAKNIGDLQTADDAANKAKTWLIISVVGGLLAGIVVFFASLSGNLQ